MHIILQNPFFDIFVLGTVTYIVRIFFSPSKAEAKLISKVLIMVLVSIVNLFKKWYLKHPDEMSKRLDTIYSHVFHSKHSFPNEKSAKIVVG